MQMLVRCILNTDQADAVSPNALVPCSSAIFLTPCAAVLTVIDGRWLERTFGRDDDRPTTAQAGEWAAPLRRLSEAEDEEIASANGVLVINKVRDNPGLDEQLLPTAFSLASDLLDNGANCTPYPPPFVCQVDQMQDAEFLEARLQEAEALKFANGKFRFQRVDAVSALAPLSLEPLKV